MPHTQFEPVSQALDLGMNCGGQGLANPHGRLVTDEHAPAWTLADPEDNEADIATWQRRD
jgi:hypothetical protein